MIPAKLIKVACAAAFAAGSLAASAASAQSTAAIDPLSVTPKRVTTVTVSIVGKDERAVRKDVRKAAFFVCRNFVGANGIDVGEINWCSDHAAGKAMKQYAAIVAHGALADSGTIVLSLR